MSFRDDKQRATACRLLLEGAGMRGLFDDGGPTQKAYKAMNDRALSDGEYIMLQVAYDIWNGSGGAKVAHIIDILDENNLHNVGGLLRCMAHSCDIDEWISYRQPGTVT